MECILFSDPLTGGAAMSEGAEAAAFAEHFASAASKLIVLL